MIRFGEVCFGLDVHDTQPVFDVLPTNGIYVSRMGFGIQIDFCMYNRIGDDFVSSEGVGGLESPVYYSTHVKGAENVSCRVEFAPPLPWACVDGGGAEFTRRHELLRFALSGLQTSCVACLGSKRPSGEKGSALRRARM